MPRTICQLCFRPEKACICAFTVNTHNCIPVIVLQHPSEVKQTKGTVGLLQQSLSHCEVIVGESFDDSAILAQRFAQYGEKIALLYPSEDALLLDFTLPDKNLHTQDNKTSNDNTTDIECIIILDGTWKKAYRMFKLNACLANIKHIVLPSGLESLYKIRKTKKNNALSSLEACCHALARLENNPDKYQKLLNSFIEFNQFQQSFSVSI